MRKLVFSALLSIFMIGTLHAQYDPSTRGSYRPIENSKYVAFDENRERSIPLRLYLPEASKPCPVVLFSHGLGGSRMNNDYLGEHWASRGYVVVYMQHPGSDEDVWKSVPREDRLAAMKKAASAKNAVLRFKDVPAVLDALEAWNVDAEHALYGKLNLSRVGMSGHSFGAVTTQAVAGQKKMGGLVNYTDERIDAAVMFSPSSPRRGKPERAFSGVEIPWLLMTGTEDVSIIGGATAESRMAVFPALPEGDKYELVLWEAEHSAFSGQGLRAIRSLETRITTPRFWQRVRPSGMPTS